MSIQDILDPYHFVFKNIMEESSPIIQPTCVISDYNSS